MIEILNRTDVKGGIGVALAIIFVLAVIVSMISSLPFKENAAWVLVTLLGTWLGLSLGNMWIKRATDYTYAAIKAGKDTSDTTTTTVVKTTDAAKLSVDDR